MRLPLHLVPPRLLQFSRPWNPIAHRQRERRDGGTFLYMTKVASENQELETTFVDLENADEDTI